MWNGALYTFKKLVQTSLNITPLIWFSAIPILPVCACLHSGRGQLLLLVNAIVHGQRNSPHQQTLLSPSVFMQTYKIM